MFVSLLAERTIIFAPIGEMFAVVVVEIVVVLANL
jgi:hypothetical protein